MEVCIWKRYISLNNIHHVQTTSRVTNIPNIIRNQYGHLTPPVFHYLYDIFGNAVYSLNMFNIVEGYSIKTLGERGGTERRQHLHEQNKCNKDPVLSGKLICRIKGNILWNSRNIVFSLDQTKPSHGSFCNCCDGESSWWEMSQSWMPIVSSMYQYVTYNRTYIKVIWLSWLMSDRQGSTINDLEGARAFIFFSWRMAAKFFFPGEGPSKLIFSWRVPLKIHLIPGECL